jgi:hypothetical protein
MPLPDKFRHIGNECDINLDIMRANSAPGVRVSLHSDSEAPNICLAETIDTLQARKLAMDFAPLA